MKQATLLYILLAAILHTALPAADIHYRLPRAGKVSLRRNHQALLVLSHESSPLIFSSERVTSKLPDERS